MQDLVLSFDLAEGCLGFCNNVAGYAGCPSGPEVVADLGEVSFNEALRRQIQIVARFQQDKAGAVEKGSISDRDVIFRCWYCAKYFTIRPPGSSSSPATPGTSGMQPSP